jgi:hypothetical protein
MERKKRKEENKKTKEEGSRTRVKTTKASSLFLLYHLLKRASERSKHNKKKEKNAPDGS